MRLKDFGKWLADQFAGQAFWAVFGPVAAGSLTALWARMSGQAVFWVYFTALGAAAFVSLLLNQVRGLIIASRAEGKLRFTMLQVGPATTAQGAKGYGVGIRLLNESDAPIEWTIDRELAHLEGKIAEMSGKVDGGVIRAGYDVGYMIGVVPSDPIPNKMLEGKLEMDISYGRTGRLKHRMGLRFRITAMTDHVGNVVFSHPYGEIV